MVFNVELHPVDNKAIMPLRALYYLFKDKEIENMAHSLIVDCNVFFLMKGIPRQSIILKQGLKWSNYVLIDKIDEMK